MIGARAADRPIAAQAVYGVHWRLRLEHADGVMYDFSILGGYNWCERARWGKSVDDSAANVTLEIRREVDGQSLAPLVEGSPLNDVAGVYAKRVHMARAFAIDVAITQPGVAPLAGQWFTPVQGVTEEVAFGGKPGIIKITARDNLSLLDRPILTGEEASFGDPLGIPLETVLQDVLDHYLAASAPTLYFTEALNFQVTDYTTRAGQNLREAIDELAGHRGAYLEERWNTSTSALELTIMVPNRNSGTAIALATFGPNEYLEVVDAKWDEKSIRNHFVHRFREAGTGNLITRTRTNAASITELGGEPFGRRPIEWTEPEGSALDTTAESDDFLLFADQDLATPLVRQTVSMLFWPWVELGDYYQWEPNFRVTDQAFIWAVVGFEHELSRTKRRTTIRTSGQAKGGVRRYLRRETGNLQGPQGPTGPEGPEGPEGPQGQTGAEGPPGTPAIMAVLTNDSHVVPTLADGTGGNYAGATTSAFVYEGSTDATASWAASAAPSTGVTGNLIGKTYTVTNMTVDTGYVDITLTRSGYPTLVVRFSLSKAKTGSTGSTGAAATAYWLVTDVAAIKRNARGIYTPASLTITAKSKTGTGAPANYSGRFIIAESTDGVAYTNVYTSAANEATKVHIPAGNIKSVRIRLYQAGGVTVMLDEEVVPVVDDGLGTNRMLMEAFATLPPGLQDPGGVVSNSGCSILSVPDTAGGKVMRINGVPKAWVPGMERALPFDQFTLYEVRTRVRVPTDNAVPPNDLFYAGVRCLDVDGNFLDDLYTCANARVITDSMGWQTYTGYVKGYGTPVHETWSPLAPSPIETGTAFLTPLLIFNWLTPAEMRTEIDYIYIQAVGHSYTDAAVLFQKQREVNTQKAEFDKEYTTIIAYYPGNLPQLQRDNLATAKSDYDAKHAALTAAISNATADYMLPVEESAVSTALGNYNTSTATFRQRIVEAVDAIRETTDLAGYAPKVRVAAIRTGNSAEVTLTIWDNKKRGTVAEYILRLGNGVIDATWQTAWTVSTGTFGTSTVITRQKTVTLTPGLDSEFHWLVRYTDYDGVVRYVGDSFDLAHLEESLKEMTLPFSHFLPGSATNFTTTDGEIRATSLVENVVINGGLPLPVGVTITMWGLIAHRAAVADILSASLYEKYPGSTAGGATGSLLATLDATVDATSYRETEDPINKLTLSRRMYYAKITINPNGALDTARFVSLFLEYLVPSYDKTY